MKALAIQQPWAWAILYAGKDVENRTWPTRFRGRFFIHASKGFDDDGFTFLRLRCGPQVPMRNDFPLGGIVGSAEIIDCVADSSSKWFFGPYGFVLANAQPLQLPGGARIVPARGALGFYNVPNEVAREALYA